MIDEWVTIDEFAREAGVATTTVRLYASRGLLPPPRKQGRVGLYGHEHRRRLRLVTDLQHRGFSLAGIKELLDAWEAGRGLDEVLGLSTEEQPAGRHLDAASFAALFPDDADREALLAQALEAGAVEAHGEQVRIPDAANLRAGLQALRLGVPLRELLAVYAEVRRDTGRLARRFTEAAETHIWQPLQHDGVSDDDRARARHALAELATQSVTVVAAAMREAVLRAAQETADRYGEDIDDLLEQHRDDPPTS